MKSVSGLYCSANPLSNTKFNKLQQAYKVNDLSGLNQISSDVREEIGLVGYLLWKKDVQIELAVETVAGRTATLRQKKTSCESVDKTVIIAPTSDLQKVQRSYLLSCNLT